MNVQGLVNCCMDSVANYRASRNARPLHFYLLLAEWELQYYGNMSSTVDVSEGSSTASKLSNISVVKLVCFFLIFDMNA